MKILYFGPDLSDSTTFKRCFEFARLGHDVTSYTFRRNNQTVARAPTWDAQIISSISHGFSLARLFALALLPLTVFRRARGSEPGTLLYARNLDMAVIALLVKALLRNKTVLCYEVLDIHRHLLGNGFLSRLLRFAEGLVLKRSGLLVVSSGAFVTEYFEKHHSKLPETFLLENKILGLTEEERSVFATRPPHTSRTGERPFTIGWFGRLRCKESLECLASLSAAGDAKVLIAGMPDGIDPDEFEATLAAHSEITYLGPYRFPGDLPELYSQIDLNWCIILDGDDGTNSRWLLPNRIYEGGFFSVPCLALKESETGRVVDELGLGWSVPDPSAERVGALLGSLTRADIEGRAASLDALPLETFVDVSDHARLLARVSGS